MELGKRERPRRQTKKEVWVKVAESRPRKPSIKPKIDKKHDKKHVKELKKWKNNQESNWEIEDILEQRVTPQGGHEVLIKWNNWPSNFNTWEPVENLNDELPNVLRNLQKEKEERASARKRPHPHQRPKSPEWYEIEEILAERIQDGVHYYLVKWKDYSETENSWEPEDQLVGVDIQGLMRVEAEPKISNDNAGSNPAKPKESTSLVEEPKFDSVKQKNFEETPSNPLYVPQDANQHMINDKASEIGEHEYRGYNASAGYHPEEVRMGAGGVFVASQEQLRYNQYFLEQKLQYMSRPTQPEEFYHGQFDISKYFLPGSMFLNNLAPDDKSIYHHRIDNLRYGKDGNIEAYLIVATNKFDSSLMPVRYWCDIKEARLKYAAEVMEYFEQLTSSKFGNFRLMDLSSARFSD